MKTQSQRTKSRAGVIAGRATPSVSSAARRSRATTRQSRRGSGRKSAKSAKFERRGQGARVIWLMMMIGGLIAIGFVLAQRSQINAHQLRQAEEKFKTQLDQLSDQQRYLALEKERAINARESDRIAKQSGLVQPELKKTSPKSASPPSPPAKPAVAAQTTKPQAAKPQAANPQIGVAKQAVKATAKPLAQVLKSPVKSTRAPAPSNAAAKPNKIAPPNKVNKDGKDQRQLAQNQAQGKKEKRR